LFYFVFLGSKPHSILAYIVILMGSENSISGVWRITPANPTDPDQIRYTCIDQGVTTLWKFWVRSKSGGKMGGLDESHAAGVFVRYNRSYFSKFPADDFYQTQLRHINPDFRKGFSKMFSL